MNEPATSTWRLKAAKAQAEKERTATEQAARETLAKELAARELAATEQAAHALSLQGPSNVGVAIADALAAPAMPTSAAGGEAVAPAAHTLGTLPAPDGAASATQPHRPSMTASVTPLRDVAQNRKESVLTEELTIEGKIEGSGNVRIAGKFKGDVNVQGNLAIEQGAIVTGSVRALTITIAGTLEGNIEAATRVELLESGVLNGDVTAESLTVAAGSRMRGKADFGWTDKKPARSA